MCGQRPHPPDAAARNHWLLALAFMLFGLLVGTSWLYSGWLENAEFFYAPFVALFLSVSFVAGITRCRSTRPLIRLLAGAGSCLLTALLLFVPYGIVWSWYRVAAAQYAIPGDAWGIEITVEPIRWDGLPWMVRYESMKSMEGLERFHVRQLTARGVNFLPPETYRRPRVTIIRAVDESFRIMIQHEGTDRRVFIDPVYNSDTVPHDLEKLSKELNRWYPIP